jgi:pseudouridine synthase
VEPGRDLVELDGVVIDTRGRRAARPRDRLYLMLNKPRGVISTARDPGGRANVVALVESAVPAGDRVYPVGRLDADSTGLVLLTNDGELAHRLAHPRHGVAKEYRVSVQGQLSTEALAQLSKGLYLADAKEPERGAKLARLEQLRVVKQVKDRRRGDLSLVSVTLREGQNREIRRLFARVGAKVRRLERVSLGPLRLAGLAIGQFRRLRADEVAALHQAVGLG